MISDGKIEAAIWDLLNYLAGIETQLKLLNDKLILLEDNLCSQLNDIDEDLMNLEVKING